MNCDACTEINDTVWQIVMARGKDNAYSLYKICTLSVYHLLAFVHCLKQVFAS